ncbi:MAG: DUF167 domain-containing protein [Planctomycetota bacterium]
MSAVPPYRVERRGRVVCVDVHVVPGSKREGVIGVHGEAVKVAVRARPEKGKANAALVELVSRIVGVRRSVVEVVSGRSSRRKRVSIEGATEAVVRSRIEAALEGAPGEGG